MTLHDNHTLFNVRLLLTAHTTYRIKKKQEELERTEKRLKSLENVKPQFVEEAERLEKELQRYYDVYMDKHRNLDYLEHELDKYRRNEEERKEEQDKKMKKMRERLLKEEVDLMRGGREEGGGGGANGMGYNSNAQGKMGSGRWVEYSFHYKGLLSIEIFYLHTF